jgi:hypothetical protein
LLLYAREAARGGAEASAAKVGLSGVLGRMKNWFQGNF